MGVALADQQSRARGTSRATHSPSPGQGEILPVVVTVVAVAVFGVAWLFGLLPALREEQELKARLSSAQRLEVRVRTELDDRRQSLRALERDPEELIRAMDETRTVPPAVPAPAAARTAAAR